MPSHHRVAWSAALVSSQIKRRGQITNMGREFCIARIPVMARDHCCAGHLINRHPDCQFDTASNRLLRTGIDKYATCLADFSQDLYVRGDDGAATGNSLKYRQAKSFGVRTKEQRRRTQKQLGNLLITQSAGTDEVSDTSNFGKCLRGLRRANDGNGCFGARAAPSLPKADGLQHSSEVLLPPAISEQDKAMASGTGLGFKTPERLGDSVRHNTDAPARFGPVPNQFVRRGLRNRDQRAARGGCARDRIVIEPFSITVRLGFSEVNKVMDDENLPFPDERRPIVARNEQDIRARLAERSGKEPPIRRTRGARAILKFRHVEVADHPVAIFTRDPPNPVRGNPAAVEQNTHRVNVLGNIRALLNFSCETQ